MVTGLLLHDKFPSFAYYSCRLGCRVATGLLSTKAKKCHRQATILVTRNPRREAKWSLSGASKIRPIFEPKTPRYHFSCYMNAWYGWTALPDAIAFGSVANRPVRSITECVWLASSGVSVGIRLKQHLSLRCESRYTINVDCYIRMGLRVGTIRMICLFWMGWGSIIFSWPIDFATSRRDVQLGSISVALKSGPRTSWTVSGRASKAWLKRQDLAPAANFQNYLLFEPSSPSSIWRSLQTRMLGSKRLLSDGLLGFGLPSVAHSTCFCRMSERRSSLWLLVYCYSLPRSWFSREINASIAAGKVSANEMEDLSWTGVGTWFFFSFDPFVAYLGAFAWYIYISLWNSWALAILLC